MGNKSTKSVNITKVPTVKNTSKKPMLHYKCRTTDAEKPVFYQTGQNEAPIKRPLIKDEQVPWSAQFDGYKEIAIPYTSPKVLDKKSTWADPAEPASITNWNTVDGKIDRRSHQGEYKIVDKVPQNPIGRTGITERGLLGKWGPNHAADPIVTRWKRENGKLVQDPQTKKNILQFIAIQRSDTKEWAIPGGMCDPGEKISLTLKREFFEEVLDSNNMKVNGKRKKKLDDFFKGGEAIYTGYVDDPRNTDNSWMETTAYNFHDEDGTVFQDVQLKAGDDAINVKWVDIDHNIQLYASHKEFIKAVVNKLKDAHW